MIARKTVAALAAMLPALAFATCAIAASKSRVTLLPGVSMTFSSDWVACDKDLNDQLHARPVPEKIIAMVCRPMGGTPTTVHLANLLLRGQVSLLADRSPFPTISEEALGKATPEMLAIASRHICTHLGPLLGVDQSSIGDCNTTVGTVSGHQTLVTDLSRSIGKVHRMRFYWVPYDQGELSLQFEYPADTATISEREIAAVLDSVEIEPGSFIEHTVALAPAPGISLSIPSGWMACDDATNALLGSRPDRISLRQKSCVSIPSGTQVTVFNPQGLQNVTVAVNYRRDKDITESQIADLSTDRLTELTPSICDSVTKPLKDTNRAIDSCALSIEQISGHAALVATVVGAFSAENDTDRERSRIYFVPYDQGFATIESVVPIESELLAQPVADAVIQSLVIQ